MSEEIVKKEPTLRELLDKQSGEFAKVLEDAISPERFIRVALTTINKNWKLQKCTQTSVLACLMDVAQLKLDVDTTSGKAYLIPYENKKSGNYICQLIIGYKGLADLAYRSGKVKSISAQAIYSGDYFDISYGSELGDRKFTHKPSFQGERGEVIGSWTLVVLEDGATVFDAMTTKEIEAIRSRSRAAKDGPWVTDWNEMAKKTVFRRLAKLLPLSPDFDKALGMDSDYEGEEEEQRLKAAKPVFDSNFLKPSQKLESPKEEMPFPEDEPAPTREDFELSVEENKPILQKHTNLGALDTLRDLLAVQKRKEVDFIIEAREKKLMLKTEQLDELPVPRIAALTKYASESDSQSKNS